MRRAELRTGITALQNKILNAKETRLRILTEGYTKLSGALIHDVNVCLFGYISYFLFCLKFCSHAFVHVNSVVQQKFGNRPLAPA